MTGRAHIVLLATLLGLVACTTVDSLKPGAPRGTLESGFMKTTEGLSLMVRGHSYDEVWAAAEAAMAKAGIVTAGFYSERLDLVDKSKSNGVIRAAGKNLIGATRAYVGIFVSPTTPSAPAYVVEVSKILKNRTEVIEGRDWEADLLKEIQATVGGTPQ